MQKGRFYKMVKINNIYRYAILWLYSQNHDIAYISQELKITSKQIKNILNKYSVEDNTAKVTTTTQPVKSNVKDLMITDSAGSKHRVAVMTKAASEIGDQSKKTNIVVSTDKPYIFKPSR